MEIKTLLTEAYKKGYLDAIVDYQWTTDFIIPVDYDVKITLKMPHRLKDSELQRTWSLLWEKYHDNVISKYCPYVVTEKIKKNLDKRGVLSKPPVIKKGGHTYNDRVNVIIDYYEDIYPTEEEILQRRRDSWF